MKKIILTVLVFSVFIFNVNSLDRNDIEVIYFRRISEEVFDLMFSDTSIALSLFEAGYWGIQPSRFYRIDGQQEDAEDRDMIDYVFNRSRKMLRVDQVAEDDTYIIRVIRNYYNGDGWFIFAQPNKTRGNWTYYLFYWQL
jgi:hypothetical protein